VGSKRVIGRIGAALACALLCACSGTAPILIPARYTERPQSSYRKVAALPGCQLRVAGHKDARLDPSFIGVMGGREVQAEDLSAWVRGGFEAGLGPAQPGGVELALETELLKAYVTAMPMTKSVDIVMRVRYLRDGQQVLEKVYRGFTTTTNWASGDGESVQAFREALQSLVTQVRADGALHCAAPAPASQSVDASSAS
jgi:hypothetical protein